MILGATQWSTNGAMIADVHRLGYITDLDRVLDPTYGRGRWWTEYLPQHLTAHDLKTDGVDFRRLPEAAGSFDVVAFDPPYIAPGGRTTSTTPDFNDRYGLVDVPKTPDSVTALILAGVVEFHRVLRPDGLLLLKCMNYVSGGRYRPAAYDVLRGAEQIGFRLVDELVHLRHPGPQPSRDRQHHARRNYSLLFVLRRDRAVR